MHEIEIYYKKFKSIILILILTLFVFIFIINKLIPVVSGIFKTSSEYSKAQKSLEDKERTLANLKEAAAKSQNENQDQIKAFFRPIEKGMDTESVIANEFAEILVLMRENSVRTRSIKYEYDPKDDNFVKNVADKYNVAKLDAEMIGTYKDFENFLKELYKHEHFLDISQIEIIPYQKDKKILIISFQMKLYAQK